MVFMVQTSNRLYILGRVVLHPKSTVMQHKAEQQQNIGKNEVRIELKSAKEHKKRSPLPCNLLSFYGGVVALLYS